MSALQDQLDEITANTRHLVQQERLAVGERAVADLFDSGIEDRILPVGAIAPEFALNDATGRLVRSEDLLALGPLVIKFFRGRWCPYCVTELEAWRDLYGTLREHEGLMVAIGPQTERQSDFMAGQHGLPFPSSPTPATALAEKFGLVYTVPEYHRTYYNPSSSTSPSSTATKLAPAHPRHLRHRQRTEKSSSPRPTPTSASAPSRERR
jgi:peroxiredoxin